MAPVAPSDEGAAAPRQARKMGAMKKFLIILLVLGALGFAAKKLADNA